MAMACFADDGEQGRKRLKRVGAVEEEEGTEVYRVSEMLMESSMERRGFYSGVIYGSMALDDRKECLALMGHELLSGFGSRQGQYYKIPQIEKVLNAYVDRTEDALRADGVLKEGKNLGLLNGRLKKDLLRKDLFAELHHVDVHSGDGILHKCVRHWAGAKSRKERAAWLKALRAALIAGADLDAKNSRNGATPLMVAIDLDCQDPLRTLLEFGAYVPPSKNEKISKVASKAPHVAAVESNASKSFEVLIGYLREHDVLLKMAALRNAGGLTIYHVAAANDAVDIVTSALRFPELRYPKLLDARTTKLATRPNTTVDEHAQQVASLRNLHQTALAKACRYGHNRIVALLLNAGASPHIADAHGRAPLHVAAEYGYFQCIKALLEAGADPALRDKRNRTPRDHVRLGASAKTSRRQSLDQYLASFRVFTDSNDLSKDKALVDYRKCAKLLDAFDSVKSAVSGSTFFGRALLPYLLPDLGGGAGGGGPPADSEKSTSNDTTYFPYLNSLVYGNPPVADASPEKPASSVPAADQNTPHNVVTHHNTKSNSRSEPSSPAGGARPRPSDDSDDFDPFLDQDQQQRPPLLKSKSLIPVGGKLDLDIDDLLADD